MSIKVYAPGNLGGDAEFFEFPNEKDPERPHQLLRMRVYMDNLVPQADGSFKDVNGSWRTVELWHASAKRWKEFYRKGMRVLVEGREVTESVSDSDLGPRLFTKVVAKYVAILPHRLESIVMAPKSTAPSEDQDADHS